MEGVVLLIILVLEDISAFGFFAKAILFVVALFAVEVVVESFIVGISRIMLAVMFLPLIVPCTIITSPILTLAIVLVDLPPITIMALLVFTV